MKVMSAPILKLVGNSKNPRECKKIDALRIKNYIGCFIYQNRDLPLSKMIKKANAPIEHTFNYHEWCDKEWCWAKQLDLRQFKLTTNVLEHINENKPESENSSDSDLESITTNEVEGASYGAEERSDMAEGANNGVTRANLEIGRSNLEIGRSEDDDDDSDWETVCSIDSDDEIDEVNGLDDEEIKECDFF